MFLIIVTMLAWSTIQCRNTSGYRSNVGLSYKGQKLIQTWNFLAHAGYISKNLGWIFMKITISQKVFLFIRA